MTYQTDERLKSYLDTNQLHREQLALAVLALDKRFTEARPRHPRGGPDGGRDIEAIFRGNQLAFAAVGFVNQADDSEEKKRTIRKKFADDLQNALRNTPAPEVFVFFTNVNLTAGEKDELIASAKSQGVIMCEIFDRERIRIALDSADGFAIRFQFLGMPLSEEEQASFFAKWGDDINSVIATGFQKIQKTLDHLLFLHEANDSVQSFQLAFELDREYPGEQIAHFRAFCRVFLAEPKLNILSILFGSADKPDRFDNETGNEKTQQPGIKFGFSGAQWEQQFRVESGKDENAQGAEDEEAEKYQRVSTFSAAGRDKVQFLTIEYSKTRLFRFQPVLRLRDFDDSMLMPMLNRSLAQLIKTIHVISNGYKLFEVSADQFYIDETTFDPGIPATFSDAELADPWVRIRPKNSSAFCLGFAEEIPERLFISRRTRNTLPAPQGQEGESA
jgi:hypothetical protein